MVRDERVSGAGGRLRQEPVKPARRARRHSDLAPAGSKVGDGLGGQRRQVGFGRGRARPDELDGPGHRVQFREEQSHPLRVPHAHLGSSSSCLYRQLAGGPAAAVLARRLSRSIAVGSRFRGAGPDVRIRIASLRLDTLRLRPRAHIFGPFVTRVHTRPARLASGRAGTSSRENRHLWRQCTLEVSASVRS